MQWVSISEEDILRMNADKLHIQNGGVNTPLSCTPKERVAMIVPLRGRHSHLLRILAHLLPLLQSDNIAYGVIVVEQVERRIEKKAKEN